MLTYPFVTLSKPVSPVRLVSRVELWSPNALRLMVKYRLSKKPLPLNRE
jgi:hypothetical protein